MIKIKKEYSYGIIAIIAIVAIVAIFNLSSQTSSVTTSYEEGESLVGEAFKRELVPTEIDKKTIKECDSSTFISGLFKILQNNPHAESIIN